MLDINIYDHEAKDGQLLKDCCVSYLLESNEEADIQVFRAMMPNNIPETETLHFVEAELSPGFRELVTAIRLANAAHPLVLTFRSTAELIGALTPEARPAGLIEKPVEAAAVKRILRQIDAFQKGKEAGGEEFVYTIKAREYRIPLNSILFFESRSKRIVARTAIQEYEFYDSLDSLSQRLGSAFVRSHRSFLVNRSHISVVDFGSMEITMDDGSVAYISRGYKDALKKGDES